MVKNIALLLFIVLLTTYLPAEEALTFLNRILSSQEKSLSKSQNRLSSGTYLLPDDPANYAIYEKLRGHITELETVVKNQMDLISYYYTSEGFLAHIVDLLQKIRELILKRSSILYSGENREYVDLEIKQYYDQILFTLKNAEFNKKKIFEELQTDQVFLDRFGDQTYYSLVSVDHLLSFFIKQRAIYGTKNKILESRNRSIMVESENLAGFQSSLWDIEMNRELMRMKKHHLLLIVNLLLL